MRYKIIAIPRFEKDLKLLAKKYPSIKNEYLNLLNDLKVKPEIGVPLGNNCYKIRISIASKRKGKSGGARVITYLQIHEGTIFLLTIFDKSETDNISNNDISELMKFII
ncbi:type II toxin-antitoxin system RelE/ParE family toxin [Pedobacter alpinus]|uniref:Type II toxin-antitoxin system RelE/ParE family toxin n=2 Tax=Pedobacter alpinus TaxID=1590643 RepID=A0ABW5TNL6_9SPHI